MTISNNAEEPIWRRFQAILFKDSDFEEHDGFVIERSDSMTMLIVTDWWTDGAAAAMASGEIDGIRLNYAWGFKEPDLTFLGDWPLKRFEVLSRGLRDLSPITRFSSSLESLKIESHPSSMVDLRTFQSLQMLSAGWAQVGRSIGHATQLEELFVLNYKEPDLSALTSNASLKKVVCKHYPRMTSLNGIEKLPNLEHFAAFLAPLSDIDALRSIEGPLTELELKSSRLYDLDPISHCTGLEFLNVSECREIESLKPLSSLTNLTKLHAYGSTRVTDGDLTPLLNLTNLKRLKMQNRRFYNPSVAEVMKQLGAQR